jgi:hypothetical protein
MTSKTKFATKIDEPVLKDLRIYAKESKLNIADIVTAALSQYLQSVRVRPAFKSAADQIISENEELLKILAK